jgi:hypothetical protein
MGEQRYNWRETLELKEALANPAKQMSVDFQIAGQPTA